MIGCLASGEPLHHRRERRRPRLATADVEGPRLVVSALERDERIPVVRAEQRPYRHRSNVGTGSARDVRRVPHVVQPSQLLFARTSEVGLGHRDRQSVPDLQRTRPRQLRLATMDRWLWVVLSRVWTEWRAALVIVKPGTVIAWRRRGFRVWWT